MNGQCKDKGLCYESRVIGDPDKTFIGDALRLRQVLINILGNAVKFTDQPGTVTFTVEQADSDADDARLLRFTVQDTGVGMDEAFLPRLFEPFAQEDSSTTNRFGGSGLGMAITKNMVDLMGARLRSRARGGTERPLRSSCRCRGRSKWRRQPRRIRPKPTSSLPDCTC